MSATPEAKRTAIQTYFPMAIAVLSLCASIYSTFLYGRFLDLMQYNVGRVEYLRTCKEVIDAYFQVKFRVGVISAQAGEGGTAANIGSVQAEGRNAVAKFAALGTYLANLRDEPTRARYTELSNLVHRAVGEAARTPPADLAKLFEPADRVFTEMNDDCVRRAKETPL